MSVSAFEVVKTTTGMRHSSALALISRKASRPSFLGMFKSSRTNPGLVAARFLLKPGRKYEQAVKAFEPYDSIKEENPEARAAGRALIEEGKAAGPKQRTFIYVNNRLEGNAISTIAAMLEPG